MAYEELRVSKNRIDDVNPIANQFVWLTHAHGACNTPPSKGCLLFAIISYLALKEYRSCGENMQGLRKFRRFIGSDMSV